MRQDSVCFERLLQLKLASNMKLVRECLVALDRTKLVKENEP